MIFGFASSAKAAGGQPWSLLMRVLPSPSLHPA